MENSAEVPAGQRAGRDKKGKPQKGTDKQRGELAEMHFMLKAAGLGFGVAKPWGESERYDFVLDTGKKFWRVQVKSTYVARAPKYSVNVCRSIAGKKKMSYTAEEIDILVVLHSCRGCMVCAPRGGCRGSHPSVLRPFGKQKGWRLRKISRSLGFDESGTPCPGTLMWARASRSCREADPGSWN